MGHGAQASMVVTAPPLLVALIFCDFRRQTSFLRLLRLLPSPPRQCLSLLPPSQLPYAHDPVVVAALPLLVAAPAFSASRVEASFLFPPRLLVAAPTLSDDGSFAAIEQFPVVSTPRRLLLLSLTSMLACKLSLSPPERCLSLHRPSWLPAHKLPLSSQPRAYLVVPPGLSTAVVKSSSRSWRMPRIFLFCIWQ